MQNSPFPPGFVKNRAHWVLVADGGQARLLELQRSPHKFRLIREFHSEAQHLSSKELVSDGSGRAFNVQGPSSHAKQQRSDPHDQAEESFCRGLLKYLDKAAQTGSLDNLVIIADPKTLGRMRQLMSKSLQSRVTDELNLDLAGLPLNKLEPRLRSVLGWKR